MQISKTIADQIRCSHGDEFLAFASARQDLLQAWHEWLATRPPAGDIEEELERTIGMLWGTACTFGARHAGLKE